MDNILSIDKYFIHGQDIYYRYIYLWIKLKLFEFPMSSKGLRRNQINYFFIERRI